jgi:hypothetical protein
VIQSNSRSALAFLGPKINCWVGDQITSSRASHTAPKTLTSKLWQNVIYTLVISLLTLCLHFPILYPTSNVPLPEVVTAWELSKPENFLPLQNVVSGPTWMAYTDLTPVGRCEYCSLCHCCFFFRHIRTRMLINANVQILPSFSFAYLVTCFLPFPFPRVHLFLCLHARYCLLAYSTSYLITL